MKLIDLQTICCDYENIDIYIRRKGEIEHYKLTTVKGLDLLDVKDYEIRCLQHGDDCLIVLI